MVTLADIQVPTLLLDERKCRANIRFMADKARRHNLIFRPHFKTHQSRMIGAFFRECGVEAITVSSLSMAQYFAGHSWRDITVAFPVNLREIAAINALARRINLNLLVTGSEAARFLAEKLTAACGFFIKIDTGYHRTGIRADDLAGIESVLRQVRSPRLIFRGFLTHAGHAYAARTAAEILRLHHRAARQMLRLKKHYARCYPEIIVSLGDTPSCSLAEDFEGVDEIRPGNFVFYDLMQERLGACRYDQIAVCLACPIVAKDHRRRELLIYGGAAHLSKEFLLDSNGCPLYGRAVVFGSNRWSEPLPRTRVVHLSQEHGVIRTDDRNFRRFQVGDLIGVLPVHSCLTASLMRGYQTSEGKRVDFRPDGFSL